MTSAFPPLDSPPAGRVPVSQLPKRAWLIKVYVVGWENAMPKKFCQSFLLGEVPTDGTYAPTGTAQQAAGARPRRLELEDDVAVIEQLDAPPLPWDDDAAGRRAEEMFRFAVSKADAFIIAYGAEDPFESAVRDSFHRIMSIRPDAPPVVLAANFTGWTRVGQPHDMGAALRLCENIGAVFGGEVDLRKKGKPAAGIEGPFYEAVRMALERRKAEEEAEKAAEEEDEKGFKGKWRKMRRGLRAGSVNLAMSF